MVSRTLLTLTAVIAVAFAATAEDKKQPAGMEAMIAHGTPGKAHAALEQMVGSWTYTGEFWMDPSLPPEKMTGTAERKMILGGKFLHDHVKGDANGPPFEGIGITGYDNHAKKYQGTWLDSMSTSTYSSTGTYDEKTRTFTNTSESFCPMRNCKISSRDVVRMISADEMTMEVFQTHDGKETKAMAFTFKRKK